MVIRGTESDSDAALGKESVFQDVNVLGTLTISGPFVLQHKEEILALVLDMAESRRQEPLQGKLMGIKENSSGAMDITFTSASLATDIGRSLHKKYWGELDLQMVDGGKRIQIDWWR